MNNLDINKIIEFMADKPFIPQEITAIMVIREKPFKFLNLSININIFANDDNKIIAMQIFLNNPFYQGGVVLTMNSNMLFDVYFENYPKKQNIIRNIRVHLLTLSIREFIINSAISKN